MDREGHQLSSRETNLFSLQALNPGCNRQLVSRHSAALIFWWWYTYASSNMSTSQSSPTLRGFPIPNSGTWRTQQLQKQLGSRYLKSVVRQHVLCLSGNKSSTRKETYYEDDQAFAMYDEFSQKPSKSIEDRIDRVLAEHYGLTDEELEFIINYDIKYRMGREG